MSTRLRLFAFVDGSCHLNNQKDVSKRSAGCGIYMARLAFAPIEPIPAPMARRAPVPTDEHWQLACKCPGAQTSSRSELCAIDRLLSEVRAGNTPLEASEKLRVFSDNEVAVKTYTMWMDSWERNGWRTKSKKPPENLDIVKNLLAHKRAIGDRVSIEWTAAHKKRPAGGAKALATIVWFGNQQADLLARLGAGFNDWAEKISEARALASEQPVATSVELTKSAPVVPEDESTTARLERHIASKRRRVDATRSILETKRRREVELEEELARVRVAIEETADSLRIDTKLLRLMKATLESGNKQV